MRWTVVRRDTVDRALHRARVAEKWARRLDRLTAELLAERAPGATPIDAYIAAHRTTDEQPIWV